jgi:uncharacterized protein
VKIIINQVGQDGLYLQEEIDPAKFDLETDLIKFRGPLKLKAHVYLINDVLTAELNIGALISANCSRCLEEFTWEFSKDVQLRLPLEKSDTCVDLTDDIRGEIILDYPIKPLCRQNCQGLCVKCGKNKNEGGCNCGST